MAIATLTAAIGEAQPDSWAPLHFPEGKLEGQTAGEPASLDGRFLSARNRSVPRQFHGEGFVNEYPLDSVAADARSLAFTTVRIENIPDFAVNAETRLKRVK